jgi:hypothetical protein
MGKLWRVGLDTALILAGAAAATGAHALEPDVLFEKVAPSVWEVFTFDAKGVVGLGSAVVIANGEVVTNCHVLANAKGALLRRQNVMYEAKLKHADVPRDLCVLSVANFTAPAVAVVPLAGLKVGQKVFAIGNPKGLEATLSEGLISGLRGEWKDGSHVIQTTAPISPGSSGGGLFDTEGRLVGITTFQSKDGQNLNFALPAEWIGQIGERAEAALGRRKQTPSPGGGAVAENGPPGYPAAGTVWTYRVAEQTFARRNVKVSIRADHVERDVVEEAVYRPDADAPVVRRTVTTRDKRFVRYALGGDLEFVEFAPYLLAAAEGSAPEGDFAAAGYIAKGYQAGSGDDWQTKVRRLDWEDLQVTAGTYRAIHYEITGLRPSRGATSGIISPSARMQQSADEFRLDVWYAPEVGRIVKAEHRTWAFATQLSDDKVELVEYRAPR